MKDTTIMKVIKNMTKMFFKTEISGIENLPKSDAVIIASNHISNIDPVLLASHLGSIREVRAMAKASLFKAPIIGGLGRKMQHIPVHRETAQVNEALESANLRLSENDAVLIYPEGTIPSEVLEDGMGIFKSGAARLSLQSQTPILPVAQKGIETFYSKTMPFSFWKLMKSIFKKHQHKILIGKLIYPMKNESSEDLTLRIRVAIAELLKKLN